MQIYIRSGSGRLFLSKIMSKLRMDYQVQKNWFSVTHVVILLLFRIFSAAQGEHHTSETDADQQE